MTRILAAPGDTTGIQNFLSHNVFGTGLMFLGCVIVLLIAGKRNFAAAVAVVGIALLASMMFGLAANGAALALSFGDWAAHLIA